MSFAHPVPLKIAALVLGTTALYTYIGQLVPQKEVQPPAGDDDPGRRHLTEDLVQIGHEIAEGKGLCFTCHTVGKARPACAFPDLDGIAHGRDADRRLSEGLQYMARSIYDPDEFIVEGFNPGMPRSTSRRSDSPTRRSSPCWPTCRAWAARRT